MLHRAVLQAGHLMPAPVRSRIVCTGRDVRGRGLKRGDSAMVDWPRMLRRAREVVEAAGAPEGARFLADWPVPGAVRAVAPATLEVLRWLDVAAAGAPAGALAALATDVAAAAPALAWRQTYRAGDVPAAFLARYGWCELLGPGGPLPGERLAGGFLLLGPHTHYPPHGHRAEELYVPLSGTAEWQCGTGQFVTRPPGAAVIHASGEWHAMRTGAAPLLALYLWRGDGLAQPARLGAGATLRDAAAVPPDRDRL